MSFEKLPIEVQQFVVDRAAESDAFFRRNRRLFEWKDAPEERGRAVTMLSQVSKSLRNMSRKHLFTVSLFVRISREICLPFFRSLTLCVVLDSESQQSPSRYLSISHPRDFFRLLYSTCHRQRFRSRNPLFRPLLRRTPPSQPPKYLRTTPRASLGPLDALSSWNLAVFS